MKNRLIRWVIFLLIGLGIGATLGYFEAQKELAGEVITLSPDDQKTATIIKRPTRTGTAIPGIASKIGGSFELVNQDGKNVTQETYADGYKLLFFGFTYCPAVCPTELQKMSLVLDEIGETAEKITPVFISVDPERDTVEQVKNYVEQFHPRLIGLTGTAEQIDVAKKAFRVYAAKVENEMMDEYMMDHSSFMYLMNPENSLVAIYPSTDTAETIAQDILARKL